MFVAKIKNGVHYFLHDNRKFFTSLLENFGGWIPDPIYLKLMFRLKMKKALDLKNPQTFNEKLQWLKLYNRVPVMTELVDKLAVKKYVADKIGEQYVIPTLGEWDNVSSIDYDSLPNRFVLKTTHGGGGLDVVVCRDKAKFDRGAANRLMEESLHRSIYKRFREWPYKNVQRKIFAEEYIEDESGGAIDYKFFCFDGDVDCVMVCLDRHIKDTKFYFFDREWNLKRLNVRGINAPKDFTLKKPVCLEEMFLVAKKLSSGFPFVRVDLYESFGKVLFGEMTFFPDAGFDPNLLTETDLYFGKKIKLNK